MILTGRGESSTGWELARGALAGSALCAAWVFWAGLVPRWPVEGPLLALALLGFARPLPRQVGLLAAPCLAAAWLGALPLSAPLLASAAGFLLANLVARTEAVHPFDLAHAAFAVIAFLAYGAMFALQHGPGTAAVMLAGTGLLFILLWIGRAAAARLAHAAALWKGRSPGPRAPGLRGVRA